MVLQEDEDAIISFIDKVRTQFGQQAPEDIAFPRSVNNLKKWKDSANIYISATPIAVKGALIYNHYIKKMGLIKRYPLIQEGEKIRFLYLKKPNPVGGICGRDHVISFPTNVPKEFDLDIYINYDLQFEKSFLDPLKTILDAIGWKHERAANLESLFG